MYKNVQVNHYTSLPTKPTTTAATSSTSTSKTTTTDSSSVLNNTNDVIIIKKSSLPAPPLPQTSSSSSSPLTIPSKIKHDPITLPVTQLPSTSMSKTTTRHLSSKSEVDQLDDLVNDLLNEVNRPLQSSTTTTTTTDRNLKYPKEHFKETTEQSYGQHSSVKHNNEPPVISSYSYRRRFDNSDGDSKPPPPSYHQASTLSSSNLNNSLKRNFDERTANSVSGLIDQDISNTSNNNIRSTTRTTREERTRIRRGGGIGSQHSQKIGTSSDVPLTSSSSTTTTTTTTKPIKNDLTSRDQLFIDEQLIDSLLESVQNTLKKRSQQKQFDHQTSGWSSESGAGNGGFKTVQHIPTTSRRTYSSSAAYSDTVHRADPSSQMRGRFPIKLYRTDSPVNTLSSRRAYSRHDNRDVGLSSYGGTSHSHTVIPTSIRATSEPPPEGPIRMERMDLLRSPSRTQMDVGGLPSSSSLPYYHYSHHHSTLPSGGLHVRGHDYSGYDTDTGIVTSHRGQRFYDQHQAYPPSTTMYSQHNIYPQPMHFVRDRQQTYSSSQHQPRGLSGRPDGYDTDTGLISSGRLRMARTLPPRMSTIPETVVVNNRILSNTNLNTLSPQLRGSSFLNEVQQSPTSQSNTLHRQYSGFDTGGSGYETDSGMHIRQRRTIPVDIQYGDSGWVGVGGTQHYNRQQQQRNNQTLQPQNTQYYHSQQQIPYHHQQQRFQNVPISTSINSSFRQNMPSTQYHSHDHLRSSGNPVSVHHNYTTSTEQQYPQSQIINQHVDRSFTSDSKTQKRIEQPSSNNQQNLKTIISSSATAEGHKKEQKRSPFILGGVGLSNPPKQFHHEHTTSNRELPPSTMLQQQQPQQRIFSDSYQQQSSSKRPIRPNRIMDGQNETDSKKISTTISSLTIPIDNNPQHTFSSIAEINITPNTTGNITHENMNTKMTSIPTFPLNTLAYNQNLQTKSSLDHRIGNSSFRSQEESSRRSSVSSAAESDVLRNGSQYVHNISKYWYKPKLSREDAISLLKTKPPGTFLIRDSQGFPGSYGLAIKVAKLPPSVQAKPGADPNAELVRHYLIERTPTGYVKLKGCVNEPDFATLSALVYQHSLLPLALPCKVTLPESDILDEYERGAQDIRKPSPKELLDKGTACNVLYLNSVDVEQLSGQAAVTKALRLTFDNADNLQATIVFFKVSSQGITLIDQKRKLFLRRDFPKEIVTYCGVDYENDRYWTYQFPDLDTLSRARCFAFVSKKSGKSQQNECHVFAEIDSTQPAAVIVNFVSKVMIGSVPV
ncbi:unnamed protein product [Didymodactylos carnosus]|uniref:SH2 domain-containing protein n=1 Tax=Didymodactylos carnosus TaxID=1234261 RepID=A0A813VW18_9BILA|nr:unnamed protein product [Didymodactylos carnosus]CAF3633774.1 unnamed protein product [Didymodactylos carnosus]